MAKKNPKAPRKRKSSFKNKEVTGATKMDLDYSTAKIIQNNRLGDRFISFTCKDKSSGKEMTCVELRDEMDQDLRKKLEAQ